MSTFNYHFLMEYLPMRYSASYQQQCDRKSVFQFKDGNCSDEIFNRLVNTIRSIAGYNTSSYVLCFIPASAQWKTNRRYQSLARRLTTATGVNCTLAGISTKEDRESGHIAGKSADPTENFQFNAEIFRGKKVILMDDVITRGTTFCRTANRLLNLGAGSVEGMFIAKTVNPDWQHCAA